MSIIPLDMSNLLIWLVILGCNLPSIITYIWGEPPIVVQVVIVFGLIIAPGLALVYNLFAIILEG